MDKAKKLAKQIINNLTGRSGFDGAWDSIDKDIQEEIVQEIAETIQPELK